MDTEQQEIKTAEEKNILTIPVAIIIAGFVIAGSLMYAANAYRQGAAVVRSPISDAPLKQLRPVDSNDHITGSPNAPVKIVEYSDTECPFCKRFHDTMHQVMRIYGNDGRVAWIYRHFPLERLHSKAPTEALASECAAALGGNDAFWKYIDRVFEITPSNNGLDIAKLPSIASEIGLDSNKFESCLKSGQYRDRVLKDANDAVTAGGEGTPYSIILSKKGTQQIINGAQPYEVVQIMIEQALRE